MSLILEALRKSEAERRRGQTPDLLTAMAPIERIPRLPLARGRPWLIVGAAAIVVSVSMLLWWPRGDAGPAQRTATPIAPSRSPPARAASEQRIGAAPTRLSAAHASTTPATSSTAIASATPPTTPALPATTTAPKSPPASNEARSAAPEPIAAPVASPPPPTPPAPIATVSPPAAPTATTAAAFTSPDLPLRLADLSQEERQQLPPLKLSMHMWAPDAAHRFVIIDGNRVGEGGRIGDAMVEAIQEDGVLLSWRGRRLRLSIR